uniref:Uncharacterized protein n=1 Tax=uncultured marine virus TaxID=186617 RepID=A0A0F7L8C2_9VIRU|nr:hypothetical protein [uncultured marine virus]
MKFISLTQLKCHPMFQKLSSDISMSIEKNLKNKESMLQNGIKLQEINVSQNVSEKQNMPKPLKNLNEQ